MTGNLDYPSNYSDPEEFYEDARKELESLNETILSQQKEIDALDEQIRELWARIRAMEARK